MHILCLKDAHDLSVRPDVVVFLTCLVLNQLHRLLIEALGSLDWAGSLKAVAGGGGPQQSIAAALAQFVRSGSAGRFVQAEPYLEALETGPDRSARLASNAQTRSRRNGGT